MVKGSTLGKMRVTLLLLLQPYVDKYSLEIKNDMEIQMLVLMPIPRAHVVEEIGWRPEDPISFFQALLPTYYFTACRTFHFSMPHLLPHKSVTALHRWELPYTSTNYFHLFNFKQLQDIYPECQEQRETLRPAWECSTIKE